MANARRPIVLLVSGQPGSGKSTLARTLADTAAIPHLNRDAIYGGHRFADGARLHPQPCWETLLSTTRVLAKAGVSVVLDLTTYIGEMEDDIRREIFPFADLVIVFCAAPDAYARYSRRIADDGRHSAVEVRELQARWRRIRPQVSEPLDLGAPVVRVSTAGAPDPPVEVILERVRARSPR